jgi:carbonic anhydrase/acetyltransferase-like protein (isoleucine patch superfamily)
MLIAYPPHLPRVHPDAFVAPTAVLVGHVIVEARASVWFQAVLRAEDEPITIGAEANVQDGCIAHTDPRYPVVVGRGVTVGHRAVLHGCAVEDGALIGMGAVVLNGARVGAEALVGSGALVPEGKTVPPRTLFLGVPGRVVRDLTDTDLARARAGAVHYVERARRYRALVDRAESPPP